LASTFDRVVFAQRLGTRRLGRTLIARGEVGSTNDVAWEACAVGAPDGAVVVADAQTHGRGRAGREWHTTPGRSLALSLLLRPGGDRGAVGLLPLAVGLAVAQALESLGARPALKWPNDVLLAGRKVAGVLCESRGPARTGAPREAAVPMRDGVVVGVGVNVAQTREELPAEIAGTATSLSLEGVVTVRETVAAAVLNALEPLWHGLQHGERAALLEAWSKRAGFWGRDVAVRTPAGEVRGVARALDPDGALRLERPDGTEALVLAGDLEMPGEAP